MIGQPPTTPTAGAVPVHSLKLVCASDDAAHSDASSPAADALTLDPLILFFL
ncbi:MAG TPA: hypothetical protein VLT59_02705 [Steroidobacteraceae bacterium]|nr:hypothetical protein [Steroidobacteraceae bacterium]